MPLAITLLPHQREVLARALADAVYYRDPPLHCEACDALEDTMCDQCATTFTQAREYLELGRQIGITRPM